MRDDRGAVAYRVWPIVRERLPAPPARVVEIGCGPLGGFVPELRSSGYEVVGVDPEAPDEEEYRRIEFENVHLPNGFDAVVASTSLSSRRRSGGGDRPGRERSCE